MLIHQAASKPNKPSLSFCAVSRLACTKFELPCILTYFTSVNAGFNRELLTAHQEFSQKKALQGGNTTGKISCLTVSFPPLS